MNIQLLSEKATIPTRGSEYAAGYDLYSSEEVIIPPGECVKVPTDIATEIEEGYFGAIFPRSGLATKQGLRLSNCVAVVDEDYRGAWFVPLYNDSRETRVIKEGDRIAQVVFLPYKTVTFNTVEKLNETKRGNGGFGSTGK